MSPAQGSLAFRHNRRAPSTKETEENILEGIKFLKKTKGRFPLGKILPITEDICRYLNSFPEVKIVSPAGSLRRRKETIGDVDLIVVSDRPLKVMDYFFDFLKLIIV